MRRQLRNSVWRIALIAAVMAAAVVSAGYILHEERLRSPLSKPFTVRAQFETVAAVAPGLGEPVNVAGVQVGQIGGVELSNGRGVLVLKIDPHKLPHIWGNARVTLVPNSPLKDMQVNLIPGGRPAALLRDGGTIPVSQATSPIDSDDLLDALDADTRAWIKSLLAGLDQGTRGRARDLNALLRITGPTMQQVRQVGDALVARRRAISRLVHNLSLLSGAAARKDRQIATVVDAGNAMLGALAGQDAALRSSIAQLPPTLADLRTTLSHTTRLADVLRPTLDSLEPTARRLRSTLRDSRPLLQGGGLLPAKQVKSFVNAILRVAKTLPRTTAAVTQATGPQITAFDVIRQFSDELAYDPGNGRHSFLYWLAWFAHNTDSVASTQDANGAVLRGLLMVSCSSLTTQPTLATIIGDVLGTTGLCSSGQGTGG